VQLIPDHWYRVKRHYRPRCLLRGLHLWVGALVHYRGEAPPEDQPDAWARSHRFTYRILEGRPTLFDMTVEETELHLEHVGATVAQPLFEKPSPLFSVSRTAWQWLDADDGIGDEP
jgi:hypothetical protein